MNRVAIVAVDIEFKIGGQVVDLCLRPLDKGIEELRVVFIQRQSRFALSIIPDNVQ